MLNSAIFWSFSVAPPPWNRLYSAIFGLILLFFNLFFCCLPRNFSADALETSRWSSGSKP